MNIAQLIEKGVQKTQGVEVSLYQGESSQVTFENSKLKSVKTSQETEINTRVIVDDKVGNSHATGIENAADVMERAFAVSEFGSPAHFSFPAPQPSTPVKMYDEAVAAMTPAEMVEAGQAIVDQIIAYNPDILTEVQHFKSVGKREFANSSGVFFREEGTSYGMYASGQLIRGTEILMVGEWQGQRNRSIDPLAIAGSIIERFRLAERSATITTGETPVIFTPQAVSVLLLSLMLALDGKNAFLGESPLKEKVGESIATQNFTLVDNPLLDFANASSSYDDEGVPHQVTALVNKGVLRNFLYDLDTAGRAGTRSTGNGPGCRPTNWVIQPGETAYADMLRNTRSGLLIQDVMGLGQGNPINGDFSVNVQLGYKIENGEITGRVKDVMLAGNVFDAIKNITAISREQKWVDLFTGPGYLPHIQVGQLSVVAK
jgi:PmbA protein